MTCWTWRRLLWTCALVLGGCSGDKGSPQAPQLMGSIRGRVTGGTQSAGDLGGTQVAVVGSSRSAYADSAGAFVLEDVPA
ncbi:MAG: hypothetical protein AB1505_28415, partial [Candidatus Latescibacterota bacterium]